MIHFSGQFDRYPNRQLVAPVLHFQTRSKETPREKANNGNDMGRFSICFVICHSIAEPLTHYDGSQFQYIDGKAITEIKNDHQAFATSERERVINQQRM